MSRARWAVVVVFLAAALEPVSARASGCCVTTTLFGTGRLSMWEDAAFGVRTSFAESVGAWDGQSSFSRFDGWYERELRLEPYLTTRLGSKTYVSVLVPLVGTARGAGDDAGYGAALGDIQLGAHHELLTTRQAGLWPTVSVEVAVLLPSGRRVDQARAPFAADATSRGALGAGGALILEKRWQPLFVHVDAGVTAYAPVARPGAGSILYGLTVAGSAQLGAEVSSTIALAVGMGAAFDAPHTRADKLVSKSAAYSTSASVTGSWQLDPHWALVGGVASALPLDGLGSNRPVRVTASAGLRFGAF